MALLLLISGFFYGVRLWLSSVDAKVLPTRGSFVVWLHEIVDEFSDD